MAFTVCYTFLRLNGWDLTATNEQVIVATAGLAAGTIDEGDTPSLYGITPNWRGDPLQFGAVSPKIPAPR